MNDLEAKVNTSIVQKQATWTKLATRGMPPHGKLLRVMPHSGWLPSLILPRDAKREQTQRPHIFVLVNPGILSISVQKTNATRVEERFTNVRRQITRIAANLFDNAIVNMLNYMSGQSYFNEETKEG